MVTLIYELLDILKKENTKYKKYDKILLGTAMIEHDCISQNSDSY